MFSAVPRSRHSFHVPVMGIGFTIDTPVRLAPYGIDSVISLVNDDVIEAARAHHSKERLMTYTPIEKSAPDSRARRITAYLDLVQVLVDRDTDLLRRAPLTKGSKICRYFELLPSHDPARCEYFTAMGLPEGQERSARLEALREQVTPGSIGVNIMTKLDGPLDQKGDPRPPHGSDAHAALRGFARSIARGPLVLSAGANPGLFAYLSDFEDFFPDSEGVVRKTLVLKVSDFRSAHVQGRLLARRGLWVSEFRIESGVNCGGHAFPTEGQLMGPILQEFADRRNDLGAELFPAYKKGLAARGLDVPSVPPPLRITAQGGIGTHSEDSLLLKEFGMDATGWGSPFLLVPEAVRLDSSTTDALLRAKQADLELSWASPLGIRFWWLRTCESEKARTARIEAGLPGSVCTARHCALNGEFGKVPLCPGSRAYQKHKIATLDPADKDYALQVKRLQDPACICVDLTGPFLKTLEDKSAPPAAICPGPNIMNFQKLYTLEEMVSHIYGRTSALTTRDRPHMFLRELEIYLDLQEEDLKQVGTKLESRSAAQLGKCFEGLVHGIEFYFQLIPRLPRAERDPFRSTLEAHARRLERLLMTKIEASARKPPQEKSAVLVH